MVKISFLGWRKRWYINSSTWRYNFNEQSN